jgi:hypothetical protein
MMKKLTLTLGGLALLASLTGIARADAITFSFLKSNVTVKANASEMTAGPGVLVSVSDSDTSVREGNDLDGRRRDLQCSGWDGGGPVHRGKRHRGYDGFGIVCRRSASRGMPSGQPEQQRNLCRHGGRDRLVSGPVPGGLREPIPYDLFGDPNLWLQIGSDSLNTSPNNFNNGGKTDGASLSGGQHRLPDTSARTRHAGDAWHRVDRTGGNASPEACLRSGKRNLKNAGAKLLRRFPLL